MLTRPIVASTAESASSSGIPAAISDPNTSSRITSVIGSDSAPAFLRSFMKTASSSLSALVPNDSMRKSRFCPLCGLYLGDDRVDLVDGLLGVALDVQRDEDGVAILGDQVAARGVGVLDVLHVLDLRDAPVTSPTAALNDGSFTFASPLWTRIISPAGCGNASSSVFSALADSPAYLSAPLSSFGAMLWPMKMAMNRNASQPPDRQSCGAWRSSDPSVLRCP